MGEKLTIVTGKDLFRLRNTLREVCHAAGGLEEGEYGLIWQLRGIGRADGAMRILGSESVAFALHADTYTVPSADSAHTVADFDVMVNPIDGEPSTATADLAHDWKDPKNGYRPGGSDRHYEGNDVADILYSTLSTFGEPIRNHNIEVRPRVHQ